MKPILNIIVFLGFCLTINAQVSNPEYDAVLAKSLGADQYGMKSYVLVLLKTGDSQITDPEKVNELFTGHMTNINRLAEEGKLIVAGPIGKNDKSYRGIFILNVSTVEEGVELVQTDPAVSSGLLAAEYFPWYGSAALPVYLETAKKITQVNP